MLSYYLKLAWLSLKKTPVISLLMVMAIAIGIGVSVTTLTIYHMMSANPMGEKSAHLFTVQLQTKGPTNDDSLPKQLSYQDVMAMERSQIPRYQTPMYKTGFAVQSENQQIKPFFTEARVNKNDFFPMFEVEFLFGGPWEESFDKVPAQVVVISHSLNQQIFAGEDSVGRSILLNGERYKVVGVIKDFDPSPKFYDLNNGKFDNGEQIFVPWSLVETMEFESWGNNNSWKREGYVDFSGKLRSEEMWLQYWAEFETTEQQQQFSQFLDHWINEQKPLGRFSRDDAAAYMRDVTQWLAYSQVVDEDNSVLVGLSFMFLVVCLVNTVGLLLAKFIRRSAEIGVRRALGASQFEVFLQHLIEVSLIGSIGGLFGLLMAVAGLAGIRTIYNNYQNLTQMDFTMVITAIVLAIVSSVLAGIYPAYRICRTNPAVHLKTQ